MKKNKGFTPLEVFSENLSMKNKEIKNKGDNLLTGFTIIELIITIFILSVAVVGVYNAFATMVVLTSNASNRLMAAYLAQEGMEVIRNIRDTNWINDYDWRCGLADVTGTCDVGNKDWSAGCKADYKTARTDLAPYGDDVLRIDTAGFYSYSAGTDTKFKRKIIITTLNDHTMNVSVQVIWKEKATILNLDSVEGSITVEEDLYNWY